MKKVLIGFFITLSVLLLSRYSQLYAQLCGQQYTDCRKDSRTENLVRPEHVTFEDEQRSGASFFTFASADTQKAMSRIGDATEIREEDDELGSSKKYVRSADCVAGIFSTSSDEDQFHRAFTGLAITSHLSYVTSGRRHISLRVIRI